MAETFLPLMVQYQAPPTGPSVMDGASPNALTAEGLMLYLESRLNGLDDQINAAFDKQKKIQGVQKALNDFQTAMSKLPQTSNHKDGEIKQDGTIDGKPVTPEQSAAMQQAIDDMKAAIEEVKAVDATLGAKMEQDLYGQGQVLSNGDVKYNVNEIDASKEYIDKIGKELESSASLEMISLQSTMSARQTSIQLATNLISALSKGTDAIAANIGR